MDNIQINDLANAFKTTNKTEYKEVLDENKDGKVGEGDFDNIKRLPREKAIFYKNIFEKIK